jgi:hypothetical protein
MIAVELTDLQRFPPEGPRRSIASDFIGPTAAEHESDQNSHYYYITFLESFYLSLKLPELLEINLSFWFFIQIC